MEDVNANININVNTQNALANLRQLQAGLSRFNQALTSGNAAAAEAQKSLTANLMQSINATGKFIASQETVHSSTTAFTTALEKNQLSMKQYFRYTAAAATSNTNVFKNMFAQEREIITRASKDRVKMLQTQYTQLTQAQDGFVKVLKVVPKSLQTVNGDFAAYATRMQMTAQRQQLMNQLLKQGSTNLLNFGKNTQWAGRQLMVGLTIPLTMLGSAASQAFKEMEMAAVKFQRVYGDMFTSGPDADKALKDIQAIGKEFTKYGVAVKDTVTMAADAAAAGFSGTGLTAQVTQANRLAVLGQIDQQQALQTTISLQNAFGISAQDLAKNINFLNAVENQTVLSLEDMTIAIPKAAPIIQQLGGDVKDLTFFLTAMKEGGINASEGANALKSGLASMINPTKAASDMLAGFGVNIKGIVDANAGNLKGTVLGIARALDTLDPLNRARAIEQMFGKFQFARISTLFQNITKDGSQASRALDLAGASMEELAILSERELGKVENATSIKFQKSIEQLKVSLVPVGKAFLQAATPIVEFVSKLLEKFNNLGDGTKKAIAIVTAVVAGIGPIALMTFGLVANGVANLIKFFAMLRGGVAKLNGSNNVLGAGFDYLTNQETENLALSNALHTSHKNLIEAFDVEVGSVNLLATAYGNAASQAARLTQISPGLFNSSPGASGARSGLPKKFANGGIVPGSGNTDSVAAMLTPGEMILTKDFVKNNPELVTALQNNSVKKYNGGPENSARSGASYRGTHNLIMGRSGFDNGSQSSGATSNLPGFLQKEYDRINGLNETQLKRYVELTGQGVGKTMDEVRKIVLEDFEAMLSDIKKESGKVTQESMNAKGKAIDPATGVSRMGKWFPKFDEAQGASFAHVGQTKKKDVDEVLGYNLNKPVKDQLEGLKDIYSQMGKAMPKIRVADAFGFMSPQYVNRGMASTDQSKFEKKHGKTVGKAFSEDFEKQGAEKWRLMTEMVGGNFDKLSGQVKIYDDALNKKVQAWVASPQNIGKPFTDDVFRSLEREVQKEIGGLIPDFKKVITKAKGSITALRVSIPKEDVGKVNAELKARGLGTVGPKGSNAKIRNVEARKEGELLGTMTVDGVDEGAGNKSPSRKTRKSGQNVAQGLIDGMKTKEVAVKKQSDRLGEIAASPAINKKNVKPTSIPLDKNDRQVQKSIARNQRKVQEDLLRQEKLQLRAQEELTRSVKSQADAADIKASQSTRVSVSEAQNLAANFAVDKNGQIIMDPQTGNPMDKKTYTKYKRGMRREAVGKVSGKLSGGLGTAAMVAGMAGAPAPVTAALGGASMVAGFAPMLAGMGPGGIIATALAATAGGLYMLNKSAQNAAAAQTQFANKTQMTTNTLKAIGEVTGKVGASEIMNRRRSEAKADLYTTNYDRKGQQFGTTFLQSDTGKNMAKGFTENLKIVGKDQATAQFASNLALAVSDGVMTAVQASDVARQMSIQFGDMTLQPKIEGQLNRLIGANGEDLLKDPLQIRINLIENQTEISKSATDQLKKMQSAYGNTFLGGTDKGGFAGTAKGADFSFGELFKQTENEKLASFGAASNVNNVASAQAQLDAYNLQAEKKIKELQAQRLITTEKSKQAAIDTQIKDAQEEQSKGAAKIRKKIGETLKDQIELFHVAEQRSAVEDAYFDALKKSVSEKYKGTSMEGFTGTLLNKSAKLSSKELEVKVNTIVASGQVNPLVMTDILDAFVGQEKQLSAILDIGVTTHGADKIAMLINNLGGVKNPTLKRNLAVAITKGTTENMDKINATLTQLQTMDQKDFNINLWLGNNVKDALLKLENLQKELDAIENVPDPLTKSIQLENIGLDASVMAGITANWEYFMSLPETVRKTAIQTYVSAHTTVGDGAIEARIAQKVKAGGGGDTVSRYYATTGGREAVINELAMEATKPQYGSAVIDSKDGKGDGSSSGAGNNPLSFLDQLAMRIKNVRQGAFDATKPLESMLAAFTSKKAQKDVSRMFDIFDGLQQRLLKLGVPKEFRDVIAGMSAADFKDIANLKGKKAIFNFEKGKPRTKANITGLTGTGKALSSTYKEAAAGEFQLVQKETVTNIAEQKKALNMLVASGMSAADALKIVENQAVATAIAAGSVGKKGSREMQQFVTDTQAATDATEQLALANNLIQKADEFKLFQKMPDLASKMKDMNFSADQMAAVFSDPSLMKAMVKDLEDGKLDAKDIADYINSIEARKIIELKTNFASGDFAKAAEPGLAVVDKMFAVQEALIRTGVDVRSQQDVATIAANETKIKDLQTELLPYQRQIAGIQSDIDGLQRNLEININRKIER